MLQNFVVSGFDCQSCIKLSDGILRDLPGVTDVKISGLDGKVSLEADREIPLEEIQMALDGTNYTVSR